MLPRWTKPAAIVGLAVGVMLLFSAYSGIWRATRLQAAATAPPLGAAGTYAVLAAAGVTNTGATVLNGDLGTHPTPAISGFFGTTGNEGPGLVNAPGTIHQADAAALAARNALTIAYNNAAAQAVDFTVGTELGTQNLAPGVYNSASGTFGLTGTLTLTGTANDVWVFKTTSTLITAASSTVTLAGGAQARNVYWQVGSSATLGASSTLRGTILANTSISLGTGASVVGRLLAGAVADSGAVTLIGNSISMPLAPPTVAKGFLPVSITTGAVSTLTIVLSNPNLVAAPLTAALTDTLPAGVVVAPTPNASTTCGAGVVTTGAATVTLTGGAIPAGIIGTPGTCTVKVDVTAALAGVYPNTLAVGALQTSNGNNAAAALATLTVVAPPSTPTLAKGFIPVSITTGGISTLTIVLSNPNLLAATLTAALTDTLPAGVVIAGTPNTSTTCGAGVVTTGAATVTLTGGAIPAGIIGTPGTCTVKVDVTAALAGAYLNTLAVGALQTSNGNNAAAALATLTVVAPPAAPTLAKGFIPASVPAGAVSTLTIVLSNPNLVAATLTAALIDSLPVGVFINSTPNASTTCGAGVVTAVASATTVTLTGGAIPAGIIGTPGTCTVKVDVTAPAGGSYVNTLAVGALQTSIGSNAAAALATLTATPAAGPPTLAKGFIPVSITTGGGSTLTITLSNPNPVAATLTAALTDTLPAGVVIAGTPNASTTCGAGVVTAVAGATTVTLTGGAIPLGIIGTPGTCTVIVDVTGPLAGAYVNTVPAGALKTSNGNYDFATVATLTLVAPPAAPALAKTFIPVSITEGATSTLTIVLSNPNLVAATLTAALTDTLPAGVVIAGTPNAGTTCGAGVVTAVAGATTVTLTGGAIPAGIIGTPGTCTVTVDVTGPLAGAYVNTLAAGALQTSNGNNAAPAVATLTLVAPPAAPALAKTFIPVSITEGATSTLTIVLSNPNLVAATLTAAFTDTLPAGVVIAGAPNAGTTCGVGVVTAVAGATTVTLTGGAIPAGIIGTPGTCTVTVDVTGPLAGAYINTLAAGALQTSNGNNAAPAAATLTVVAPPSGGGGGGGGGGSTPTPTATLAPATATAAAATAVAATSTAVAATATAVATAGPAIPTATVAPAAATATAIAATATAVAPTPTPTPAPVAVETAPESPAPEIPTETPVIIGPPAMVPMALPRTGDGGCSASPSSCTGGIAW